MGNYNATVYTTRIDRETGKRTPWGTFVAEVREINGRFQMLRANHVTCTGYEGKILTSPAEFRNRNGEVVRGDLGDAAYDLYIRLMEPDQEYMIVQDDGEGYRTLIRGTNLPPSYQV